MKIVKLFRDESIIVCIKPAGLDSQEGMCSRLREELGREVFCVHRLDKDVGGVMVYALSSAAAASLSAAVAQRRMEKEYLAVITGKPEEPEAVLRDRLYRDASKNKSYVVKRMRRGVRQAELEYKLLEQLEDKSLLKIKLQTGRSHQIRVQFSSRAMPLLGDVKYGSKERSCHIALWSYRLAFPHPERREKMEFLAMPEKIYPWNEFEYFKNREEYEEYNV